MPDLEPVTTKFIEVGEHEKGFAKHFEAHIAPLLNEIETKRLATYATFKSHIIRAILIWISVVGLAFVGVNLGFFDSEMLSTVAVGSIGAMGWFIYMPIREYKNDVKSKFMPVICSFYGDISYSLTGTSHLETKYAGQIFPSYNRRESEDFISGEYKKVTIKLHEATLRKKSGKVIVTVFHGLVLELDFPKTFKGKTLLCKDEKYFGNLIKGKAFHGLQRIELEDPEFEAMFQVFSSDQVEARFVLTTAFMERLLALARLRSPNGASIVQCVFEENQMVIAIPTEKDLFEPGSIRKSALLVDDIHIFLSEVKEIFELIDLLKLTRNPNT